MKAFLQTVLLLTVSMVPAIVAAQPLRRVSVTSPPRVAVQTVYHQPAESNKLRTLFADILREEIEIAGFKAADDGDLRLVVSAIPVSSTVAAITVSIFQVLPQAIVDLAAEHEAFYLAFPTVEMPPEGKEIRQYMSRDYMQQFMMLVDQYERVTSVSELRDAAREVVDLLVVSPDPAND